MRKLGKRLYNWLQLRRVLALVTMLGFLLLTSILFLLYTASLAEYPAGWSLQASVVSDGHGILWQVQTTFLSVGFAALAIAAQLFTVAPLAIGASREHVLRRIGADLFLGIGLVGNIVLAIETLWLSSDLGLGIAFIWFLVTVGSLVVSMIRLMRLFGKPSLLDEVIRTSLVNALSTRLVESSRKYSVTMKQIDGLVTSSSSQPLRTSSTAVLRVPVPEVGSVIKTIKPKLVKRALDVLKLHSIESSEDDHGVGEYRPPQVVLYAEPGDRTRFGDSIFGVITHEPIDEKLQAQIVRLLQSSIEFESPGVVTPVEEIDHEIAGLKDAVGTNIRSGAFSTAERAVELLGNVVRSLWVIQRANIDTSRRASVTHRDWLFRSIGEVEQDSILSQRAAGMFVHQAMRRAREAPRTGSSDFVDESLRSFLRIWLDILQAGGQAFDPICEQIVGSVQNLAAFDVFEQSEDISYRASWAMVELIKVALDVQKYRAAIRAPEAATLVHLRVSPVMSCLYSEAK